MSDGAVVVPTWRQIIDALETMDPADLAARMPKPPDTAQLVRDFPELAPVDQRDITLGGPHGDVPARLYRVHGVDPAAALVWVHGGAFIAGDLAMAEAHWVALALAAQGIPVLSVEYRKCLRDVHFPVPSDDVLAAWQWAISHSDELGTSPNRFHLGGASAGGNLTAGVTKRLRDGAGPMPASVVLAYPVLHKKLPPPSEELLTALAAIETTVTFTPEAVRDINLQYTGNEDALDDQYAFAGNGDVSGQPPVYILNSEADRLRPSGERYAQQLRDAGVEVMLELEPGTQHGHLNEPYSPGGQRSVDRVARWLMRG